jgi:hypothetical protein
MIPKGGGRFSEKIMLNEKSRGFRCDIKDLSTGDLENEK